MTVLVGCGGDDDGGGSSADARPGGDDAGSPDAAGPATITIHTYDGPFPSDVTLLAYQDGDGDWQLADGGGGTYSFTIDSGRYAVALVCDLTASNGNAHLRTTRLLTSDATELAFQCPWHQRNASFTGSVTGQASGDNTGINLGTARLFVNFAEPDYSAMVLAGRADLLASRYSSAGVLLRMIIERDFSVSDGGSHNFALGAGGFAPVVNQAEVTGVLEGETTSLDDGFFTHGGEYAYLGYIDEANWAGVPAAELEPDDIHVESVFAGTFDDNTYRKAYALLHAPADITLALPAPGADPTITVADTAPYVQLHFEPARAASHRLYLLHVNQTDGPRVELEDAASSAWLDAGYPIDTPDLSALDGWNPDWEIHPGMTLNLTAYSYATDTTVAHLLDALALTDAPGSYWGAPVTGLDGLTFTRTTWSGNLLP
jgi:hypothetical protein